MAKLLLRLIDWYLKRRGETRILDDYIIDVVSSYVRALTADALPIVRRLDTAPQGGEWKRHQAYAELLKKRPEASKRDIALAIERAVRML